MSDHGYPAEYHSLKYICWTCNRGWKVNPSADYGRDPEIYYEGVVNCSKCNGIPMQVSHIVRFPKQKDQKKWKLLRKIIETDFKDAEKGTLADIWCNSGGMGCTLHMKLEYRKLFWIPTKMRDYDRWFNYMTTTMIMHEDDRENEDKIRHCLVCLNMHLPKDISMLILGYLKN